MAIWKCHHCDAGRLIDESQSRALVRGNISLFAPGRKGDGTNPDPGEAGLPSFVVARAGAVAPTTTSTRGATYLEHPIASSIRPRSDTPAGRGVSQVPVSQFLTSQPLEDGTDCVAVAVIFQWECNIDQRS